MRIALLWACLLPALQEAEPTYTDEERGFSIPIPKGWSVTRPTDKNATLILKAPAEARTGATCLVHLQDAQKDVFEGKISLETYLEEVKKQYPKRFQDFEWVRSEKGKDGENPTLSLIYRYTNSGQKIEQLQHLIWTRNQHYSLSWGCLNGAFEKNRDLFEKASRAFKPLPKK